MDNVKRKSGVLAHVSSLWGDFSSGSLGKEALEWLDFLADCKFSVWQVLPFCRPDEFNSPYKSLGAFSTNPFLIDIPTLYDEGVISKSELEGARQSSPYLCEFERLRLERLSLLKKAASRFKNTDKIDDFMQNHPETDSFCMFMALKDANGGGEWTKWNVNKISDDDLFFYRFCEYTFHAQWQKIKDYANSRNISVVGDVPMYVSHDSADVWENPDEFLLDADFEPTGVAGVPPDYFCPDGQVWGNPLYNRKKMKENGFSWWRRRMRFMGEMFDGVRIDHFRAVDSYFKIPPHDKTAKNGKWQKGPGMPFVNAIKEAFPEGLIIAEDLGEITDSVRRLVEKSSFPGMRVLQFAFSGGDSVHLPHNYTKNSVAYTGTHDNNTLLGYVWECGEDERKRLFDYCGYDGENLDGCYEYIMRTMMQSHAALVVFPVQDLLFYGRDTRLNTPGKSGGNWDYRFTKEQIMNIDKGRLAKWNETYKRAPES